MIDLAGLPARAAAVLGRGRAMAETLMVDACTVTAPGAGARVLDQTTLEYSGPAPTTVYAGKCQVKQVQGAQFERPTGEQVSTLVSYVVKLPIATVGVREGQTVKVTAAALDPDMVGLELVVRAVNRGTRLAERRLVCTEFA